MPSPPEAGCRPASAIARPVCTEQETPSPSSPSAREGDDGGVGLVAVALLQRRLDRPAAARGPCRGGYARRLGRVSVRRPMAIATATTIDMHVGGKLLFADVSFKLEPRERMTLSGRNGAGKSTLLRDAGRRAAARLGQPRPAERRPRRPARPAPAARRRGLARRVRLLRPRRHDRDRGASWRGWRRRWPRAARRGDDARLRRGPAAARSRRRLPLARRRARRPARPRLRRGGRPGAGSRPSPAAS